MPKHFSDLTRLDELRLVRELKEVILEYLTTLHPLHTSNLTLLICRHVTAIPSRRRDQPAAHNDEIIMIRGIAYLTPDKSRWELVAESSRAHFGILAALQEFSKDLEREMGMMVEGKGREKRVRDEGNEIGRSGLFAEEDDMMGDWEGRQGGKVGGLDYGDGDGSGKRFKGDGAGM